MYSNDSLTTAGILAAFADEIISRGGTVSDTYNDGKRLFTRSVLPRIEEVRPSDGLQGGVALRARAGDVLVRPYLFRQVCRNGAIWAHSLDEQLLIDLDFRESAESTYVIREAVGMCCAAEVFSVALAQIRDALDVPADIDLDLLTEVGQLSPRMAAEVFGQIIDRFFDGVDQSRFGLMNAITSLARDTGDPALRWELEELGGGVLLGPKPTPKQPSLTAARRRRRPVATG